MWEGKELTTFACEKGEKSETGETSRRAKEDRRQEAEIRGQRSNVRGQGRFIRELEN